MSPSWPWARQTPGGQGIWGDAQFIIDQPGAPADWWVVYDDLQAEEKIDLGSGQSILVTPEPPALKQTNSDFAAQFDRVITSDRQLAHPHKTYSHQALPWHVGRLQEKECDLSFSKNYDELKALGPIAKPKLISVIASNKSSTPGHRARAAFVQRLREHFGARIEIFGWGHREIGDKWDGIAPFRYHIAIENSYVPDYWTEKLADAFLAGAHPIYHGCPNILDFFPAETLSVIDINQPYSAIESIEAILRNDPFDPLKIAKARNLVLDRHNLFPLLAGLCAAEPGTQPRQITLRPASAFYKKPSLLSRARRRIWK